MGEGKKQTLRVNPLRDREHLNPILKFNAHFDSFRNL